MAIVTDSWAKKMKDDGWKILVVVMPISGNWIHKKFFVSAMNVYSPAVVNKLADMGIQTTVHVSNNFPIDYSRNQSIDVALDKYLADYVFFMDTDMTFPGNTILNMLELISDETPIVTGMYYKKSDPFGSVTGRYTPWDEDLEKYREKLEKTGFVTEKGEQCLFYKGVHYFDKDVPFWVDAFGMGCVLAKGEALRKLKKPYFKYTPDPKGDDETLLKNSEDMWFCAEIKKAGITVLCDPRVQCGHICEIESTVDLMEGVRDSSFALAEKQDPEHFKTKILPSVLDVRGEQNVLREALKKEQEKL